MGGEHINLYLGPSPQTNPQLPGMVKVKGQNQVQEEGQILRMGKCVPSIHLVT